MRILQQKFLQNRNEFILEDDLFLPVVNAYFEESNLIEEKGTIVEWFKFLNEFAENKGMEFFKDARQMGVAIKYSLEVYKTRLSVFRIITGRGNQKSLYVKINKNG